MKTRYAFLPLVFVMVLTLTGGSELTAIVYGAVSPDRQRTDSTIIQPSVDFDIVFPVPERFRNIILDTLESFGHTLSRTPRLAVSAMEDYDTWAHFTLVPAEVIESGWQTSFQNEDIIEVVIIREHDGTRSGYVVNAETLPILAEQLPTYFAHRLGGPDAETYLFPWTSPQEWYKTQGWHAGYTANAIDFAPVVASNPPVHYAILGSKSGSVIQVCDDGYQKVLRLDHADASTYYLHLDSGTVPDCILNASVARGQYLGLIYSGTAEVNGYCDPELYPDLQYNTACGCGTGPHLHFETSDRSITIDGYPINDVANSASYTKYQSSNTRTDECVGCCGCLPASCCSSALAAGSSDPDFMLYDDYADSPEPEQSLPAMSVMQNEIGQSLPTTPLPPPEMVPAPIVTPIPDTSPPVFTTLVENQYFWSAQASTPVFSWQGADDEGELAGYKLYWGDDPNGIGEEFTADTTYTPTELPESGQSVIRYLRVAAEDAAGNQSAWQTVAIGHYDPVAPTGTLTVANGSPTVRTLNVVLNLDASDEGSSVTQMRFSSDGRNWTAWETFAGSKAWQLANTEEQQTIFAQVQDEAGNISETLAASITAVLNVELPSSPSYSIARSTFGMGGGDKSSPSYQVRGTSGQPYRTGRMQSINYRVNSGYWAGSVCPTAEFVISPTISTDGSTVTLSWLAAPGATSYNIYRDTTPYFTPTSSHHSTTETSWDDPDGAGDPGTNYTYIIKPVNNCGESSTIYRLGAFDFGLTPGS